MTTIVILLLLLAVAVSNIVAHIRITRLLKQVVQLNLARRDEIHDLRNTTLEGFQRAYNVTKYGVEDLDNRPYNKF
jgi:hypothetical protein